MKKTLGLLLLVGLLTAQGVVWAEEAKPAVPAAPAEKAAAVKDEAVLHTEGVVPGPANSAIVDADKKKAATEGEAAGTEDKEETEEKY